MLIDNPLIVMGTANKAAVGAELRTRLGAEVVARLRLNLARGCGKGGGSKEGPEGGGRGIFNAGVATVVRLACTGNTFQT